MLFMLWLMNIMFLEVGLLLVGLKCFSVLLNVWLILNWFNVIGVLVGQYICYIWKCWCSLGLFMILLVMLIYVFGLLFRLCSMKMMWWFGFYGCIRYMCGLVMFLFSLNNVCSDCVVNFDWVSYMLQVVVKLLVSGIFLLCRFMFLVDFGEYILNSIWVVFSICCRVLFLKCSRVVVLIVDILLYCGIVVFWLFVGVISLGGFIIIISLVLKLLW